jgi:hypothetical protein
VAPHHAFRIPALATALLVASVGAFVAAPSSGAGQGNTRRVPESIDSTGTDDVTEPLQEFLDGVPNGSVIEFRAGARYRIEGTLALARRRNLTVEGNGATVFATTEGERERSQWTILGGSRIAFRDLIVKGAHPAGGVGDGAYQVELEAQHGFNILGATDVELDRVTVTDVYGDFVYMGAFGEGARKRASENVWVHDSTFARNGRQGVAITAATNVVVERNQIDDVRRATFDFEPNSPRFGAKNVHILDNTVGPGRLLFVASHGNGPVDDVVISGNQLPGHPLTMSVRSAGDRRANWWVTDNVARRADRTPMSFQRVDGVVVRGNTSPVTREGASGVGLVDVCGYDVSGNNFAPALQEVSVRGEPCEGAVNPEPPEPPDLRGRDPDAAPAQDPPGSEPPAASGQTAGTTTPTTLAPSGDEAGGRSDTTRAILVALIGVLVIGGVTALVMSSRAKARRRRYRSY